MNTSNGPNSVQFPKLPNHVISKDNPIKSSTHNHNHRSNDAPVIRDVWEDNFEEEFRLIMDLIDEYPIVAMDTEFPGAVYDIEDHDMNPMGHYEMKYKKIKMNVDKLKVIQVGVSLADEEGNMPPNVTTWQFNFKFNINVDEHSKDAIKLLFDAGLKFDLHAKKGIASKHFAEYLIGSGLVMNKDIKWVVFDGGYDFAYLIRMLEGQYLPENETQFYNLLNIYFPSFYDVKYMVRDMETLRLGGLNKIATELNIRRYGAMHQAGSDALLTLSTFFKLMKSYMKNMSEQKYMNVLDGIPLHNVHSDEVWRKAMEYPYMMFNNYGMQNMQMMEPSYFAHAQADTMYNNMANNPYKMHYYPNYPAPTYPQDSSQKPKKYDNIQVTKSKPSKN